MKLSELLEKLETTLETGEKNVEQTSAGKNPMKEIILLIVRFFSEFLMLPFKLLANYLKNELITAVKRDAKLYGLMMGLMGVLFVFFSVLWLFIAVGVGVYFYQKGNSLLLSIFYSVIFQIISFIVVALVVLITSKQVKSIKMIQNFNKSINDTKKEKE